MDTQDPTGTPPRQGTATGNHWARRLSVWWRGTIVPAKCDQLTLNGKDLPTSVEDLCKCLLDQYLGWKLENLAAEKRARFLSIFFSAITPAILLIPGDNARLYGALSSAVAAIATGLMAAFAWRENHIRYGYTWHALQGERNRYLLRMPPTYAEISDVDAARIFAQKLDLIVSAEVNDWRAMMENLQYQAQIARPCPEDNGTRAGQGEPPKTSATQPPASGQGPAPAGQAG